MAEYDDLIYDFSRFFMIIATKPCRAVCAKKFLNKITLLEDHRQCRIRYNKQNLTKSTFQVSSLFVCIIIIIKCVY